jgi:hypothetical protein
MTAMEELKPRISRRKMLGGAAAGAAVVAAGTVGRVPVAQAADGDPLLLGEDNYTDTTTHLSNSGTYNYPVLFCSNIGDGHGIVGQSTDGIGVNGASKGIGVAASSNPGIGLDAWTDTGRAIHALAIGASGLAFHAEGAVKIEGVAEFARSGKTSIAYPAKSAVVAGIPLSSSSLVIATVQNSVGVWVASAVPNIAAESFQINLNKAPGSATKPKSADVAWLIVN